MRHRWAIVLGFFVAGGTAFAQALPTPVGSGVGPDAPALVLPFDPPPLNNGVIVSQPLNPVAEVPASPPVSIPPAAAAPVAPPRTMPASWYRGELLLWWPRAQPLPPLAVVGRDQLPRLGVNGVRPLIGGDSAAAPDTAGARFVIGWALSDSRTYGVEFAYFFLGTNTQTASASRSLNSRMQYLGRPYLDANTGLEEVSLVAAPNAIGEMAVSTSGRLTGWEANLVRSLYDGSAVRLSALAGYRYFMLNEGLRIESRSMVLPNVDPVAGAGFVGPTSRVADQFDAHNRFHGGQVGLRADVQHGSFFAELDAKIGIGRTVEVVRVSGLTVLEGGVSVPVGVYGQPSNSGRFHRSAFAVLPEGGLRLGWRLGSKSRVFLGYSVTYLSEVVRPGDQLDRVIDPIAGGFGDRPGPLFNRSDFWVQGLSLGLEWRY